MRAGSGSASPPDELRDVVCFEDVTSREFRCPARGHSHARLLIGIVFSTERLISPVQPGFLRDLHNYGAHDSVVVVLELKNMVAVHKEWVQKVCPPEAFT